MGTFSFKYKFRGRECKDSGVLICWDFKHHCGSFQGGVRPPSFLSVASVSCLCLIPRLGARFTTTGVEGNSEVTAFTFGLLKTGDKKPAARKESRILKDVIYHLCQTPARTVWKTARRVRKHSLLSIFESQRVHRVSCCSTLFHTLLHRDANKGHKYELVPLIMVI